MRPAGSGTADVPVSRMRAGDVGACELAELLSPSLFAEERIVVPGAAAEAGATPPRYRGRPPPIFRPHCTGPLAAGAPNRHNQQVDGCGTIRARGSPRSVSAPTSSGEFASLRVKVDDETDRPADAVGSDVRELASACSQLVADTGGAVDAAAVRRYHSGKAEVRLDIADKAVAGDVAEPPKRWWWAMMRGEPLVVLADALAEAVHTIGRVGSEPDPGTARASQ